MCSNIKLRMTHRDIELIIIIVIELNRETKFHTHAF